jgi:hypothetical protein
MVAYQIMFLSPDLYKQLPQCTESPTKEKPGKAQNVMCRWVRHDWRAPGTLEPEMGRNQNGPTFELRFVTYFKQ